MARTAVADLKREQVELGLQSFLTYRLARVHAKLNTQAAHVLREHAGLTLTQWRIIALLGVTGEATSTTLTRSTAIDKGLFSRNLRTLVDAGLVVVKPDRRDQRQHTLCLSAKGRSVYQRTLPIMRARQSFLLGCLSPKERDAVFSALDKLSVAAEVMNIPERQR